MAKPGAAIYLSQVDPRIRPVIVPAFFWDSGDPASGPNGPSGAGGVRGPHRAYGSQGPHPVGPGPSAMIASNCERIDVFVDGQHAGTGQPVLDAALYGHLAYPPTLVDLTVTGNDRPELRIEGYVGGQQVAVVRMSADPAGDHLGMSIDDAVIEGDGCDATRVVFRALDAYGNQRRYRTGEVRLQVDGPAELIGDNPFALGAYGGLGAVWVRSRPGTSGPVRVTARHPELGQAQVQLTVAPASPERLA